MSKFNIKSKCQLLKPNKIDMPGPGEHQQCFNQDQIDINYQNSISEVVRYAEITKNETQETIKEQLKKNHEKTKMEIQFLSEQNHGQNSCQKIHMNFESNFRGQIIKCDQSKSQKDIIEQINLKKIDVKKIDEKKIHAILQQALQTNFNNFKFNKENIIAIYYFLVEIRNNSELLGLFKQICQYFSNYKDNGMLYMFSSIQKIKDFIYKMQYDEGYRIAYKKAVDLKVISIFNKCSNKKIPTKLDLLAIIQLAEYKSELIKILSGAKLRCLRDFLEQKKSDQLRFKKLLENYRSQKKLIKKIINQCQDTLKSLESFDQKDFDYVVNNLITTPEKLKFNEIIANNKKPNILIDEKLKFNEIIANNKKDNILIDVTGFIPVQKFLNI